MKHSFEGKVVVVTGANRGIGKAAAEIFAAKGAKVYALCRNKIDGMKAFKNTPSVVVLKADVTNITEIKRAFNAILNAEKHVDVLLNNAGVMKDFHLSATELDIKRLKATFDVNLLGAIEVSQVFLPLLRKSKTPTLINMSSGMGAIGKDFFGGNMATAYRMSKVALNMYTRTLADELKKTK